MDYVLNNTDYEALKQRYKKVPAMTPTYVHDYLRKIGSQWTGKGVAVELGSWLGATAAPLLEGLKQAGYDRHLYCFDRWKANREQVGKAKKQGVKLNLNQNLIYDFMNNVKPVYKHLVLHQGNINETIYRYSGEPIEICLFDAPKTDPLFSKCVKVLSKHWIPGVTILGLLDYYFYKKKDGKKREDAIVPVRFIENNSDCFEKIAEWPTECACVFFKYVKKL